MQDYSEHPDFTSVQFGANEGASADHQSNYQQTHQQQYQPKSQEDVFDISVLAGEKAGDFVSYTIHAKTTLEQYKNKDMTVERRYKDFDWLKDALIAAYPACLVPPLPEKSLFARFSEGLIEYRKRELERFLKRVTSHPKLSVSNELKVFLEATEDELTSVREQKPAPATTSKAASSSSTFGGWSFGSFLKPLGLGAAVTECDNWFTTQLESVNHMEEAYGKMFSAAEARVKKFQELAAVHEQFSEACQGVKECELESNKELSDCFQQLADMSMQAQVFANDLSSSENVNFQDAMKDYLRVFAAVKRILQYRTTKLGEYQDAERNLAAKKANQEKQQDANMKQQAANEVVEAENQLEESRREYETVTEIVREELERFNDVMTREMRETLSQLVQSNMSYELRVNDLWKKFLLELNSEADE